ncbi:MAG: hypothetical protein ACI4C1_08230 [Lachnospiraceae bacterium]
MSEKKKKEKGGLSRTLDSYFHFTDRSSTMSQEVKAGLSVCFISVCALFMNIQILIQAFSDDIPYCGLYLGATLVAFVGTLLLGLVCNLPLVQTASLSLSTVMISVLGVDSGLTYENLLAVTFVAAVVYLILMAVPKVRSFVFHLIPDSVRLALPVGMGLYIAYVALQNMGVLDGLALGSFSDEAFGGAVLAPYMRWCAIAALIGFALIVLCKKWKSEHPVMSGFVATTLIFYLIASVAGGIVFTYTYTQNRIWVGVNPDPLGEMYTIGLGFKELQIGQVFAKGFDFSAFTAAGGNVVGLFARSILLFLFMGMYESEAAVLGANENGTIICDGEYEEKSGKILFVNAVANVIAPIVGAAPVSIGKQSAVATADGGKTGLSSVVCSIGYFVALFTWLPFVIFATYTKSVPEYGHAGFVFPNVIYATFQIADAAMLFVGLNMLKGCAKIKSASADTVLPFAATIVITVFTQNIAYGVAAGALLFAGMALLGFQKGEAKATHSENYVMAILAIVLLVLSMNQPVLGGTTTNNTGNSNSSTNTNDFTFDEKSGDFSFEGKDGISYYTVWVYRVDEEGNLGDSYVAASGRLTGTGEISGNVDIAELAYGEYQAVLNAFAESGTNPEAQTVEFIVSGKLSTPEFMYSQDGTNVKITLFSDTLSTYNDKEMFTVIDINIYDKDGNLVKTETITKDELTVTAMGPFTNYTCEKTITLEEGNYQIALSAEGNDTVTASDESEKLDVEVKNGATSEGQTSGYVVQEGGGMPF